MKYKKQKTFHLYYVTQLFYFSVIYKEITSAEMKCTVAFGKI